MKTAYRANGTLFFVKILENNLAIFANFLYNISIVFCLKTGKERRREDETGL